MPSGLSLSSSPPLTTFPAQPPQGTYAMHINGSGERRRLRRPPTRCAEGRPHRPSVITRVHCNIAETRMSGLHARMNRRAGNSRYAPQTKLAQGTNYRLLSRTPGFRPSVNSKPAASSTCRRLSTVRLRSFSPRSKRTTVSGDTFAAAANFLTLKPMAALAIRHCIGSTCSEPLFSLPGSAVAQRDCRGDERASADHVEDQ
jgi:hypothetical protein